MKPIIACQRIMLFLFVAVCSTSMAAEPGFYVGAGIGYADIVSDEDDDDINEFLQANGITATLDNDTSNFNFRVSGGYWFSEKFGVELSYLTLGEVDVDATITAPVPGTISTSSDLSGVEIVVQYAYPFNQRVDIIGKLGAVAWDGDVEATFTGSAGGLGTLSTEDDGTDFTIGIGFAREMKNKNWVWRSGYQYIDTERVNHLFSSGFQYRFK